MTIEEKRLEGVTEDFYQLYIDDCENLISQLRGCENRVLDSITFFQMWDNSTQEEQKVLKTLMLLAHQTWKIPSGYFKMSPYQQGAVKAGLCDYHSTNEMRFVVLDPTSYAEEQGYKTLYYPLEEGLEKWAEYVEEGLDSLFTMTAIGQ